MTTERIEMERQLKSTCVPLFREYGCCGSFPNFYRDEAGFVSLLNFQFYSSGGSFCVNLSYADKVRDNVYFRKKSEPKCLSVSQTTVRVRLGASNFVGDKWFSFGATSYGEVRGTPSDLEILCEEVNLLFVEDALQWWQKMASAQDS